MANVRQERKGFRTGKIRLKVDLGWNVERISSSPIRDSIRMYPYIKFTEVILFSERTPTTHESDGLSLCQTSSGLQLSKDHIGNKVRTEEKRTSDGWWVWHSK